MDAYLPVKYNNAGAIQCNISVPRTKDLSPQAGKA